MQEIHNPGFIVNRRVAQSAARPYRWYLCLLNHTARYEKSSVPDCPFHDFMLQ
jgi:hypothetical protein